MPTATRRTLLGGAASLVTTRVASAPDENVVRWASAGGVLTWDPHGTTETPSLSGSRHVYETLTAANPDLTLHPDLATAWKLVGPLTWEFELREEVTFHDSAPFTALDVVFSLERARAQTSDLTSYTHSIAAVRAVGEHKVEITTTRQDLLLPINLRNVGILSQAWAERYGVVAATRYADSQAPSLSHANGTGPFILEFHEPGRRTVLVRNPSWWGQYLYPHNIDRIEWTIVPDPGRGCRPCSMARSTSSRTRPSTRSTASGARPGLSSPRLASCACCSSGLIKAPPSSTLRTSRARTRSRISACVGRSTKRST
jgi:peptide/nickel transport system substrate-binding protein